jgi:cobaltochelatase CobN
LVALGVRPVWDDAGRPIRTELIPMAELQRPRVDVLLSVTGSYRDQFPALMALIDQAVAVATTAEDGDKGTAAGNAIARNTAQVASELRQRGLSAAQAQTLARARVFGNVVGDYGTGVSDAVQSDGLRRDEPAAAGGASGAGGAAGNGGGSDARLGELFLQRMSQPYVDGQALTGIPAAAAAQALGAHLRQTDAAVLSRSSNLYAMVTSDDPFQYLGGLAAAARSAGKKEALGLYVSQLQDVSEATTETAQRSIALEMQSRYLHPGWLQAQKAEGYSGTLQVLKAVQFAWGWQAVAPDTIRPDHWQSFFDVLVKDKHKLGLPQWMSTHPQAYAQALERLVQAQRLGYWEADKATQQQLATVYQALTRAAPLNNELAAVRQWAVKAALGGDAALVPDAVMPAQAAPPAPTVKPAPQATPTSPPEPVQPLPAPPPPPPKGLLLERQPEAVAPVIDADLLTRVLAWLVMGFVLLCGAAFQGRRNPPSRV